MKNNSQVSALNYWVVPHIATVDTCEDSLGDQDDHQQEKNREKARFVEEKVI